MWDLHEIESDPHAIYVTAKLVAHRGESWLMSATLECDAERDGGDVALHVTDRAERDYGLAACVNEFERWVNTTLEREYRLGAVLAMAQDGPFYVVATAGEGPSVLLPPKRRDVPLAA